MNIVQTVWPYLLWNWTMCVTLFLFPSHAVALISTDLGTHFIQTWTRVLSCLATFFPHLNTTNMPICMLVVFSWFSSRQTWNCALCWAGFHVCCYLPLSLSPPASPSTQRPKHTIWVCFGLWMVSCFLPSIPCLSHSPIPFLCPFPFQSLVTISFFNFISFFSNITHLDK